MMRYQLVETVSVDTKAMPNIDALSTVTVTQALKLLTRADAGPQGLLPQHNARLVQPVQPRLRLGIVRTADLQKMHIDKVTKES